MSDDKGKQGSPEEEGLPADVHGAATVQRSMNSDIMALVRAARAGAARPVTKPPPAPAASAPEVSRGGDEGTRTQQLAAVTGPEALRDDQVPRSAEGEGWGDELLPRSSVVAPQPPALPSSPLTDDGPVEETVMAPRRYHQVKLAQSRAEDGVVPSSQDPVSSRAGAAPSSRKTPVPASSKEGVPQAAPSGNDELSPGSPPSSGKTKVSARVASLVAASVPGASLGGASASSASSAAPEMVDTKGGTLRPGAPGAGSAVTSPVANVPVAAAAPEPLTPVAVPGDGSVTAAMPSVSVSPRASASSARMPAAVDATPAITPPGHPEGGARGAPAQAGTPRPSAAMAPGKAAVSKAPATPGQPAEPRSDGPSTRGMIAGLLVTVAAIAWYLMHAHR